MKTMYTFNRLGEIVTINYPSNDEEFKKLDQETQWAYEMIADMRKIFNTKEEAEIHKKSLEPIFVQTGISNKGEPMGFYI